MVTQELIDYIQRQKESGVDDATLKNMLLEAGWEQGDVDAALTNQPEAPVGEGTVTDFQPAVQDTQTQVQPGAEAVAAPQTPVQNTVNQQPTPRKKPFLRRFLLLILLLALIAGGVYAYMRFYYFAPDKVYAKVAAAYANVESFEVTGQVTVKSLNAGGDSVSEAGEFDILSGYFPKEYTIKFGGYTEMPDKRTVNYKMSVDANAGVLPLVKGELLSKGDNLYFNPQEIVDLGEFDTSFLLNQWIRFSLADFYAGYEEGQQNTKEFTKEQEDALFNFLRDNPPLIFDKQTGTGNMNGDVINLTFNVDKQNLVGLLIKIGELTNEDYDESELKSFREYLNEITFGEGQLSIGKKDMLIYSFILPFVLKQNENESVEVFVSLNFANYNIRQEIAEPQDAKTLEEIFKGMYGGLDLPEDEVEDAELEELQDVINGLEIPDDVETSTVSGT